MARTSIIPLHWNLILERIGTGFCVPFLGAGVNVRQPGYDGLPLGGEVALRLVETMTGMRNATFQDFADVRPHISLRDYRDLTRMALQDLPRVALRYESESDAPGFLGTLQGILPDEKRTPSRLLLTLASLPFPVILTTNYDRLMERAMELFHGQDLRDPAGIAKVILQDDRPLFAFLRSKLSAVGLALFAAMNDPAALAVTLDDAADPLTIVAAAGFRHWFGPDGKLTPGALQGLMCQVVLEELNTWAQLSTLYADERFAGVAAPPDLRDACRAIAAANAPDQLQVAMLNRQLLSLALPDLVARQEQLYRVKIQPIRGFQGREMNALREELAMFEGRLIYKLHGSFGTRDKNGDCRLVITEEDYIEFLAFVGSQIPEMISQRITDSTLLFLGYGLEDWNFRTIFKGLVETLPNRAQRKSFAIQKEPSQFWVDFWSRKQVEIYDMDLYQFGYELETRYRAQQPGV